MEYFNTRLCCAYVACGVRVRPLTHYGDFAPMPRRNHPPKRKSKHPRPDNAHPALENADPTLIDSRILADLAKKSPNSDDFTQQSINQH